MKTITIRYSNGQEIKTRTKNPARALSIAINKNPLAGSIKNTLMLINGKVFGIIEDSNGWSRA